MGNLSKDLNSMTVTMRGKQRTIDHMVKENIPNTMGDFMRVILEMGSLMEGVMLSIQMVMFMRVNSL